jgi:uncharacterized membrane protein
MTEGTITLSTHTRAASASDSEVVAELLESSETGVRTSLGAWLLMRLKLMAHADLFLTSILA